MELRRELQRTLVPVIIAISFWAMPGASVAREPLALIVDMTDDSGAIVTSDGKEHAPILWEAVYADDVIAVAKPNAYVKLETAQGEIVTVMADCNAPNTACSPHVVRSTGMNLTGGLMTLLARLLREPPRILPGANLQGRRAGKPRVAVEVTADSLIGTQHSSLTLPLTGGTRPYHVVIRQHGLRYGPYEDRGSIVRTARTNLRPGDVEIEIRDSSGQASRASLKAVDVVPRPPTLTDAESATDVEKAMWAAWLWTAEDGRWKLEALQRFVEMRRSNRLAGAFVESVLPKIDR
jgi:hypothetical protein